MEEDIGEDVKREVLRRQTWLLEERERARRSIDFLSLDFASQLESDSHLHEVIYLEELERHSRLLAIEDQQFRYFFFIIFLFFFYYFFIIFFYFFYFFFYLCNNYI